MKINDSIALITLTESEENVIEFVTIYRAFNIQNLSDTIVYVSLDPGVEGRTEGVMAILPKNSVTLPNRYLENNSKLYAIGAGRIQIHCNTSESQSFKSAGGDGSGSGASSYNDLPDKPSINGNELIGNLTSDDLGISSYEEPIDVYKGASGTIKDTVAAPAYITDFPVNLINIKNYVKRQTYNYDNVYTDIIFSPDMIGKTYCFSLDLIINELISAPDTRKSSLVYGVNQPTAEIEVKEIVDGHVDIIFTVIEAMVDKKLWFRPLQFGTTVDITYQIKNICLIESTSPRGFIPHGGGTAMTVGKNLFNINGDVSQKKNGEQTNDNYVVDNILTTTANVQIYPSAGQNIKCSKGKYIVSGKVVSINCARNCAYIDVDGREAYFNNLGNFKIIKNIDSNSFWLHFGCVGTGNAQFTNIMVEKVSDDTTEPSEYEPYQSSSIFLSPNTEKPVAGLKSFNNITNIISDFNISLTYFKSKKDAVPTEALKQEIDYLKTYSGQSGTIENTVESPAYITDFPVNLLEARLYSVKNGVYENGRYSGLKIDVNEKTGEVTIDGTSTSSMLIYIAPVTIANNLESGEEYTFTIGTNSRELSWVFGMGHLNSTSIDSVINANRTFAALNMGDVGYTLYLSVANNITFNNEVFRPMLIKGSEPRGFIPYGGGTVRTTGKNISSLSMVEKEGQGYIWLNNSGDLDFEKNVCVSFDCTFTGMAVAAVTQKNYEAPMSEIIAKQNINLVQGKNSFITTVERDLIGIYVNSTAIAISQIQFELNETEPSEYEPYQESKTFISPDTEKPVVGLKTFDGITHIFSDFGIDLKYFKDTEKAVPDAALENKINDKITTIFSGSTTSDAPAEIANHAGYKYLLVRLADNTAGVLTADDIAALTDTATAFTVGSGTYNAKIDGGVLQMWSDENLTVIGVM